MCKLNIANLEKNGPLFRLNFLHCLVRSAKDSGDTFKAARITGIIQKEKMCKRWRWINRSTRKARGGLTIAVRIPTADRGVKEYRTKEGVENAVSPIILEHY